MTALKEFPRLEATGLWRASPEDQRREVIVSLGDATLTISETSGRVLAHWSLGAVRKTSDTPAIFHPDGDPGETLELPADEAEMIDGINRLLRAIERRRPHPGKLRLVLTGAVTAGLLGVAVFWLPDALERYTVRVVPPVKRAEIGQALMGHLVRVTGAPCMNRDAERPLRRLAIRLLGPERPDALRILPGGVQDSTHLPGGLILLGRAVVEDHEDPDVVAGYIIAESVRAAGRDPLADLLDHAGMLAGLRLLTTGALPDEALSAYAEHLLTAPRPDPAPEALLPAFAAAQVHSTAYAYARDITGETTLTLIEADPMAGGGARVVLSDADWVRLQGICGA